MLSLLQSLFPHDTDYYLVQVTAAIAECTSWIYKEEMLCKDDLTKTPWDGLHIYSMGLHNVQILNELFWACLWRYFWMKLIVNWSNWLNPWPCPVWVSLIQATEGLHRTGGLSELEVTVCAAFKLAHLSFPVFWVRMDPTYWLSPGPTANQQQILGLLCFQNKWANSL